MSSMKQKKMAVEEARNCLLALTSKGLFLFIKKIQGLGIRQIINKLVLYTKQYSWT